MTNNAYPSATTAVDYAAVAAILRHALRDGVHAGYGRDFILQQAVALEALSQQPAAVEGFRTVVEKARRVWMDENPCEDGHDHVTPFDQFLYGSLAQQPAAVVVDYAKRLATSLWQQHYREDAPQWEPCGDLMGLLSQIDNMVSGLTRAEQQPAAVNEAMVERATMALLGKSHDSAPGVDWACNRTWTVNYVRERMRAALIAAQQQGGRADG